MNKAIFLDRDGVLNIERGEYTYRVEDTSMVPEIGPELKKLQDRGYLLIVVSNQGGIAKGLYGNNDVVAVNAHIAARLAEFGVELDAIYYCPHHPEKTKCLCRKPLSLLFERALHRYKIDPVVSYMIGDKQRDIDAAEAVGIKGILMEANTALGSVIKNAEI